MSFIKVMSPALSNRIAAGEVIERPASVVKELVENAIDAGATKISILVERAGSRSIRVTDNGCGMDREDVLLALEPHGTSKLLDEEMLSHIGTLGFRGEAIPSIASVSRFTIRSRRAESAEGAELATDGGAAPKMMPCGGAVGTTVIVRDLFFNMPARRKFLKSPGTEEHHVEEQVLLLALGHSAIGFELKLDGRQVLACAPGGTLEVRVRELFGKSFAAGMRPVEHREGALHIFGLTGAPGITRTSRREQRIFINGRAVESPAVYRGIKEGYGTLCEENGRYAPVVLFLEIPPEEVDVNVHPAKREVRFRSEFVITRAVASAVAAALRGETPAVGEALQRAEAVEESHLPLSGKIPMQEIISAAQVLYRPERIVQPELSRAVPSATPAPSVNPGRKPAPPQVFDDSSAVHLTDRNDASAAADAVRSAPETAPAYEPAGRTLWPEEVIGIFDNTYILASSGSTLMIVDQHAAHERVMFERICDRLASGGNPAQRLLLPQVLELPRPQLALLLQYSKVFEALGFDFESAGGNTVIVNALPVDFDAQGRGLDELFPDMLAELLENSARALPVNAEFAARAACRAAVKAHDPLSPESALALLKQLRACRQGTLCPHGRPTMIEISLRELEKRFGRR